MTIEELENKIEVLEEENRAFKEKVNSNASQLERYNEVFHELIYQIQELSKIISEEQDKNMREHALMTCNINNVPFEVSDKNEKSEFFYPKIIDSETTIEKIINEKKSIARFGDGEFAIIFGHARQPFQRVDERLAVRLKEVLQSERDNLLIGIAKNYGNLEEYTDFAADGIRIYMQPNIRREHMQVLSEDKTYYNAYLSRPYVMYRDNNTDAPAKRFAHLQQIWNDRSVIMIEGAQTRLGVGNDLFEGCKQIRRILAPPTNSFDRYDEILEKALEVAEPDVLFLIATGPSAGVFAYDLSQQGYQALDIGHIDIEYEWFKRGTGKREEIANKYTNEIPGHEEAVEEDDPAYKEQIIGSFV